MTPVLRVPGRSRPFDADETLSFADPPLVRYALRAVSLVALAVYAAYLTYRALYTINFDALGFSLLVYAAELHGFFSLAFYFHQLWALRTRRVPEAPAGLSVDVFVTTYNEEIDLLRQTLRAAVGMRYPHTTYVLDDGRRAEVRALAEELGCRYITRRDNTHAKAGNWNNAFMQTSAELIATFDADHVPSADFLDKTLGFFQDARVAIVQVPQQYHNLDSVQHRVNWKTRRMYGEQDVFFNLVMPGKDHWNAAFFCGTGAVLRRKALEPHGGILTGTITEDLHTSMVLHAEGWRSVYLNEVLVTGLAPMDLRSFETQRLRWAEGNLRTLGFINPVTAPGLSLAQRTAYLASLYHWTIGIPKLIFYLAPPWILVSGHFPIANFDRTFLFIYLSFLGTLVGSYLLTSRGTGRLFMDELFNMASFFTLIRALKRATFGRGRPLKFEVTAKRGSAESDLRSIWPHVLLLTMSLLAITWSLMGLGFGVSDDLFGAGIAMFWTLYNVALMIGVIQLGTRPSQKRRSCRFRASLPVEIPGRTATRGMVGVTADISEGGCALLWPERLERGSRVPLRLHFGTSVADWTGEIVGERRHRSRGWHVHMVRFVGLTQRDVDLLNDSLFSLLLPRLFSTLSRPSWARHQWQKVSLAVGRGSRTRPRRRFVHLPVRVGEGEESFLTVAHDLSATGVGLIAPREISVGSRVAIEVADPERPWRAEVIVARCIPQPSRPGFDTWLWGLQVDRAEDGRAVEQLQARDAA